MRIPHLTIGPKTKQGGLIILLGILAVSVGTYRSCAQQQAPAQIVNEADIYPKQFPLSTLPQGFKVDFGLRALPKDINLQGSLCWIGYKNDDLAPPAPVARGRLTRTPLIQRVDMQGGAKSKVLNFKMPIHDPGYIDTIGIPMFRGTKEQSSFRVSLLGQDYTRYQLYNFSFANLQAKSEEVILYPSESFHFSPNGRSYAYTTSPPDYSDPFYLLAKVDGQVKGISEDQPSMGFSWTSDNHLLHTEFASNYKGSKYYDYPSVYENDLKGKKDLVKEGGFRPILNRDKQLMAYIGPDTTLPQNQQKKVDLYFNPQVPSNAAVFVYDRTQKKEFFVKKIYEQYPDLVWVGDKLYVIENIYVYSKKMGVCRISEFDGKTGKIKELGRLEQKGESSNWDDAKLAPSFQLVGVANERYILLQVPLKPSGADNYHLVSVSLQNGTRSDLFSFSAPVRLLYRTGIRYIDWIEGS